MAGVAKAVISNHLVTEGLLSVPEPMRLGRLLVPVLETELARVGVNGSPLYRLRIGLMAHPLITARNAFGESLPKGLPAPKGSSNVPLRKKRCGMSQAETARSRFMARTLMGEEDSPAALSM